MKIAIQRFFSLLGKQNFFTIASMPIAYSLLPAPCSLLPAPCSLLPIPYSLFPIPCSLFPVPEESCRE
ncbi:hypothetical protein [Moorena sp. SIO3H5]|uniref:hypothetical protein n=1 Tax=Moorena sp. SIO3H5 TaxID=2607834 RepID=UPI0013BD13BE|nr:hypothetical protein [Moorena sp. SIO3H5]NEO68937.1 hypothetical protein [Moorena sp. SIO3H5]